MTSPKQQTIGADATLEGVGVHTGGAVRVTLRPAPESHGIRFRRLDLAGAPEIPADLEHVSGTELSTSIEQGEAGVRTVEHVLAAAYALGVDNLLVELDGPEMPILDGSFKPFFEALSTAGIVEQAARAKVISIDEPLSVGTEGASYVVAPAGELRVSGTIEFEHAAIGRQYASFPVTPQTFEREIAPARTFGFLRDAEALQSRGLARGVTTENAVILDDDGPMTGPLRYDDEFVRHKIGDVIGDLALTGGRIRGHVVAERPSHAGNLELAREIARVSGRSAKPIVDIQQILQYLPHRFPMLLVDRIVEFESGKRIVGIKNVTINEPFFQGHYPGHPIMPGVLIIEAMAQVGGLLLMDTIERPEDQVVYFMSLDNVKWRRPVTPGDQIRFELEVLNLRRHVCRMRGIGTVDGHLVAEAEMMARIMDR